MFRLLPLFASAVLRYNAKHENHMGFANPVLYDAINLGKLKVIDITKGTNKVASPGEKQDSFVYNDIDCCDAATGHDRASGWGSIPVDDLLEYEIPSKK
jgi:hypothetical protein